MQRPSYSLALFTLLMSTASIAHAREITLPKSLIIELVDYHCSYPKPDPNISAVLSYDCYDNETQDSEFYLNYSLELIPLIAKDYNQDSVADIAVEVRSSGALGGNVHTNSSVHYLLLDKNKKIINEHQILLYAPFSENIVDYKINKSHIYYSAVPNYRSNPDAYKDGSPIDPPLKFEVNWVNGVPISTYYQDNCRLARIKDKTLLDLNLGGTSYKDIDSHDYTQVITESIQVHGLSIEATLSGCNLSTVLYDIEPQDSKSLPLFAEVLKTLIPRAHHSKQLKMLQNLEQRSELKFAEEIFLYNGWQAIVRVDRNSEIPNMRIVIQQTE